MNYKSAIKQIKELSLPYEAEMECLDVLEQYKGEFDNECSQCIGTGLGQYDGGSCQSCQGTGIKE